jgi:RP/EB family microtubule-associated protein
MDSAYFVSKNDLLKWINDTLHLDIAFIEDLGAGSIYCQLLDAYHRQAVPMGKLNWRAKFEYEFVANLKLFQQGLERIGCSKKIDVNKLAKAKYQDNLELIQWLKRYLEMTATRLAPYDATARRNGEVFHSPHSQKNSYVNRPGKPSLNATLTPTSSAKKEGFGGENLKQDKLDKIKRVLESSARDSTAKL